MVLGKLPVLGHAINLDCSRARAYCLGGCLDIFSVIYHFPILSPSLWETAMKYCLKGPLTPKQSTNHSWARDSSASGFMLFCCHTSTVNSYDHVRTVSSSNHTIPG